MGECQFLPSISAPLNDQRQKLNKHEVPGGETLKEDLVSPDGPLHFRLAINTFAPSATRRCTSNCLTMIRPIVPLIVAYGHVHQE